MPRLPDHFDVIDKPTPEKPFRLITAPARSFLNTSFTETSDSIAREHRPTAFLNSQDCMDNEWKGGDRVILGNEKGNLTAFVEVKAGQQPGVVVIEGLWPAHYFESEVSVNALTSSDPGFPNGGAVFHDTAIWIRKLTQDS